MKKKIKFGLGQRSKHAPLWLKRLRNTVVFMATPTVIYLKAIGVPPSTINIVAETLLYIGSGLIGVAYLTGQEEVFTPEEKPLN